MKKKLTEKEMLAKYDHSKFPKPSVTVDIIICTQMIGYVNVLLIKRKHPPFMNSWAIPGGFLELNRGESLEEAAARELYEETNLKGIPLTQLGAYGDPNRDPRMRVITVAYLAVVPYQKIRNTVKAKDDAKEAEWFNMGALPELAFDHKEILRDALTRLMGVSGLKRALKAFSY